MDMRIAGKGNVPSGEYNAIKLRGSGRLYGKVRCVCFKASGSSKGETIECAEGFNVSGSSSFTENIKAKDLRVYGSLKVGGDMEAENAKIVGGFHCKGLLNAENITLQADTLMSVGSIGGSNIFTKRKAVSFTMGRRVVVETCIEGDNLNLSYVTCPRVTGRVVVIGKGCKIDLVQYSEEIKIHRKAKIGKVEKI